VLIEFDHGRPIIVDRSLYRELVKAAITRTAEDLQAKVAAAAEQKKTAKRPGVAPADPLTTAKRERDQALLELSDQAHGANLDLGAALLTGLSTVDPADMDVARCFVLCGLRHRANYADAVTMPTRPACSPARNRLRRTSEAPAARGCRHSHPRPSR
jgi:hypothetical protein